MDTQTNRHKERGSLLQSGIREWQTACFRSVFVLAFLSLYFSLHFCNISSFSGVSDLLLVSVFFLSDTTDTYSVISATYRYVVSKHIYGFCSQHLYLEEGGSIV